MYSVISLKLSSYPGICRARRASISARSQSGAFSGLPSSATPPQTSDPVSNATQNTIQSAARATIARLRGPHRRTALAP